MDPISVLMQFFSMLINGCLIGQAYILQSINKLFRGPGYA